MVEEYLILKKSAAKQEQLINKQGRQLVKQERIIAELRYFLHDSLSEVFSVVQKNKLFIEKTATQFGYSVKGDGKNDPFAFYQGFIELCRPLNFSIIDKKMRARIKWMEEKMEAVNDRANKMRD